MFKLLKQLLPGVYCRIFPLKVRHENGKYTSVKKPKARGIFLTGSGYRALTLIVVIGKKKQTKKIKFVFFLFQNGALAWLSFEWWIAFGCETPNAISSRRATSLHFKSMGRTRIDLHQQLGIYLQLNLIPFEEHQVLDCCILSWCSSTDIGIDITWPLHCLQTWKVSRGWATAFFEACNIFQNCTEVCVCDLPLGSVDVNTSCKRLRWCGGVTSGSSNGEWSAIRSVWPKVWELAVEADIHTCLFYFSISQLYSFFLKNQCTYQHLANLYLATFRMRL